eukprot:325347_1
MAEQKVQEPLTISLISLICAGSGQSYGKGRKMAIKTNQKANACDANDQFIEDGVNLMGCDEDAATMARYVKIGKGLDFVFYKSKRSCCDAEMSMENACKKICRWVIEEEADVYDLYFSGHGTDKKGGGICFADGILYYKNLANVLKQFKKKRFVIIIDACHAGCIVNAFSGTGIRCCLYYACKANEVSADNGSSGGYFTSTYFQNYNTFMKLWATKQLPSVVQNYSDGTSSRQSPGKYKSANFD